jgi:protease-4
MVFAGRSSARLSSGGRRAATGKALGRDGIAPAPAGASLLLGAPAIRGSRAPAGRPPEGLSRRGPAAEPRAPGRRAIARAAFLVFLSAASSAFASSADLPPVLYGNESVVATDGASGFFVNPAAGGLRYPNELLLSWSDLEPSTTVLRGALALGGFALAGTNVEDGPHAVSLGLAGGKFMRVGARLDWLRSAGSGSRATDLSLGVMERPSSWFAFGASLDHVMQPRFMGGTLRRNYTMGVGLRPLAWSPRAAYALGPRWTISADVAMREGAPNRSARVRVGGELEVLSGVALRGAVENGGFHAGLALLGPREGYHGHAAFDRDGERLATTHSISFHEGAEDRTVLDFDPGAVVVVKVGGALADESLPGGGLLDSGGGTPARGIHRQLERALDDPKTRGVLIEARGVTGMAQVEELRPRIRALRAAGKPVVAYLEYGAGRAGLYLASACDRVVTTPGAYYRALGLRIEQRYYRGLLEKWGVKLERSSFGEYKSGFRNFSADSSSAPDREVIERVLDVNQALFVDAVTADRGIDRDRLAPILDGRDWPAEALQRAGLVDSIGHREDALRILGRMVGLGDTPGERDPARLRVPRRAWHVPARVAVVYASGGMELGESGNNLMFGPYLGARTFARQIEAAFKNPEVRAVVLRIESPGGATLASRLMHHAVERMKRETKKPLVVSMGAAAASGGYHMAVPADRIYANRFTYTGSIGVFYIKPSLEGLYANWGVRQEDFERGRYMRGLSPARDWDAEIQAIADSATYREYESFVADVARGRGMAWAAVDAVARGRTWMGEDARARGLVDGIGTLEDAIAEARRRAKISEGEKIRIAEYGRPRGNLFERFVRQAADDFVRSQLRLPEPGTSYYRADLPIVE